MEESKGHLETESDYRRLLKRNKWRSLLSAILILSFLWFMTLHNHTPPVLILGLLIIFAIVMVYWHYQKTYSGKMRILKSVFPLNWSKYLEEHSVYYLNLSPDEKVLFNKRVQLFLAEKKIDGVDTDIDEYIKLLVAASAIIPTFAFPNYNYPNVQQVLIYPNSFDEHFQTKRFANHEEFITGMVGNRFMTGTVIISKPDLISAFDGSAHKFNVGIHEFVHLLDKQDGAVDGVPEAMVDKLFIGPWLHEIKKEINDIEKGKSDISPYALTNNAEFLAVVSEYFFSNPEKFHRRHPDLYNYLCSIFHQKT